MANLCPSTEEREPSDTFLNKAQVLVDKLYDFRNHYFQHHDMIKASEKNKAIADLLTETLNELDKIEENCQTESKAKYLLLRGKALNVLPTFDETALRFLEKAVKFEPKLVEAWNELGECYWKKGDMDYAKNCFVGALTHEKNKVSLRQLSMVLRQLKVEDKDKMKNIEESVEKAKEAVQLDPTDGTSWCILGNAYLTLFFTSYQNPKLLKQATAAYVHAEKDKVALDNPDLHYNRAIVWKYEEEYQQALESFARAYALDPIWKGPKEKEENLMHYLLRVKDLLATKGQLKARQIQSHLQSLVDSQLGPYRGGSYTAPNGKSVQLREVVLNELTVGINLNKVVLGSVVCSVTGEEPVPFTFGLLDRNSTCWSVTVYNLAQGKGVIIGDTVAIPEPFVQEIKVKYKDKEINYWNIRIDSPLVMVVNGKKLRMDKQAMTEITVSVVMN